MQAQGLLIGPTLDGIVQLPAGGDNFQESWEYY